MVCWVFALSQAAFWSKLWPVFLSLSYFIFFALKYCWCLRWKPEQGLHYHTRDLAFCSLDFQGSGWVTLLSSEDTDGRSLTVNLVNVTSISTARWGLHLIQAFPSPVNISPAPTFYVGLSALRHQVFRWHLFRFQCVSSTKNALLSVWATQSLKRKPVAAFQRDRSILLK